MVEKKKTANAECSLKKKVSVQKQTYTIYAFTARTGLKFLSFPRGSFLPSLLLLATNKKLGLVLEIFEKR